MNKTTRFLFLLFGIFICVQAVVSYSMLQNIEKNVETITDIDNLISDGTYTNVWGDKEREPKFVTRDLAGDHYHYYNLKYPYGYSEKIEIEKVINYILDYLNVEITETKWQPDFKLEIKQERDKDD